MTPTAGGRLRVGVDGRAFASPAGGVRRYVWELYRALREADPDAELVAIGAPRPRCGASIRNC